MAIIHPITQNPNPKPQSPGGNQNDRFSQPPLLLGQENQSCVAWRKETQGVDDLDWDTGAVLEEPLSRCDPEILLLTTIVSLDRLRRPPI